MVDEESKPKKIKPRPMAENTSNITNLNRATGKFETKEGGRYWHPKYSGIEIAPGVKHGKLIVWKIDYKNGRFYCWTEGLEKLKIEPVLNSLDKPDGCHHLAVIDNNWLDKPVADWEIRYDRWI